MLSLSIIGSGSGGCSFGIGGGYVLGDGGDGGGIDNDGGSGGSGSSCGFAFLFPNS